ncbi:MAG: IS5 family transposase, partial [Thermodesulfobacteriota bacterium]|nr:IS5 family transposase [Thermodesulfobacteriota bacterium]
MIRYQNPKQLGIEEFKTPFQQKLDPANRWIKLSRLIPWDSLAAIYYKALSADQGRPGIDARRIIGAIIIKHKLNLSDEETVLQVQENAYLQYFLGYSSYEADPVFSPTLFVEIRKRLGSEKFDAMNNAIIDTALKIKMKRKNKPAPKSNGTPPDNDSGSDAGNPQNKGKMLIDATVAEQAIKYPNDLELLNDCRQESEKIIDKLFKLTELKKKPRTYRRTARKEFLSTAKKKRKPRKELRKAIGKQLNYLSRNLKHIEALLDITGASPFPLKAKHQRRYWIIQEMFRQQKQMHDAQKHSCSDRIVSISQPHVRPIVRGKARNKTEFGAKIGVSMWEGYAIPDTISWNAYNESQDLIKQVGNYIDRFGHYPEAVIADNIYGTKNNRDYLKSKGIRFSGKPLGRPKKQTEENKEELRKEKKRKKKEYRERIPIEGKFGQGKNGYRLNYIRAKLQETSESW